MKKRWSCCAPHKLIVLSLSMFLIFNSCKKDEEIEIPDCELNVYGTVTVTNKTPYNYWVYVIGEADINGSLSYYYERKLEPGKKFSNIHLSTVKSISVVSRREGNEEGGSVGFVVDACQHHDIDITE